MTKVATSSLPPPAMSKVAPKPAPKPGSKTPEAKPTITYKASGATAATPPAAAPPSLGSSPTQQAAKPSISDPGTFFSSLSVFVLQAKKATLVTHVAPPRPVQRLPST